MRHRLAALLDWATTGTASGHVQACSVARAAHGLVQKFGKLLVAKATAVGTTVEMRLLHPQ
jgi:hypothetical protein